MSYCEQKQELQDIDIVLQEEIKILHINADHLYTKLYKYTGLDVNRWKSVGHMISTINIIKNALSRNDYDYYNKIENMQTIYNYFVHDRIIMRYKHLLQKVREDIEKVHEYDYSINKWIAASLVQEAWREAISNPYRLLCQKRLEKEFAEM